MKGSIFLVIVILAATIINNTSFAGAGKTARAIQDIKKGHADIQSAATSSHTRIVRVTTPSDAVSAMVPAPSRQSINLNSTRFFLDLDGLCTLYNFDPMAVTFHKRGPLFPAEAVRLLNPSWSAVSPDVVYGLDASGSARICSYDVRKGTSEVIRDFSPEFGLGQIGELIKSRRDDDHFSFAWRGSDGSAWRYLIVWERTTNTIFQFDLNGRDHGLSGYRQSYFDGGASNLIIAGDSVIKWQYTAGPAAETVRLNPDSVEGSPGYPADPYSSYAARWEAFFNFVAGKSESMALSDESGRALMPVESRTLAWGKSGDFLARTDAQSAPCYCAVSADGRFLIFNATTDGGRPDVYVAVAPQSSQTAQAVNWVGLVNCVESGSSLIKNAGGNGQDDAHAFSQEAITDQGSIEFTAEETGKERWCGLTMSASSYAGVQDIAFGLRLTRNGKAVVVEQGSTRTKTKYRPGDVFTITVEAGDSVNYLKNGSLFYTSTSQATLPLQIAASLFDQGATIGNGSITQVSSSGAGPVLWTSIVNCTAASGSLQKTSGRDDTPDAGGVSQQTLTSGDGYVEFIANETNKERWCGLGTGNLETNPLGISFAWKLTVASVAAVREAGVYRTETTYQAGDRFRIAVTSGVVKYYKNSALIYTSSIKPSYPLQVSASFINLGGTIASAVTASATAPAPLIGVSITPASASLQTGQTQQFQAAVSGTANTGVTWSATGGSVTAGGLYTAPQTPGSYSVKVTSAADPTKSASAIVTVTSPVSPPPAISGIAAVGITSSSATITWATDQVSDSAVEYGTSASYGNSSPANSTLVTSHSVTLSGLAAGSTYHYRVKSRNSAGILAVSPDSTFVTSQQPGGGVGGGTGSVPVSYSAVTDRTPRPVPALPSLGGAGSAVIDPSFGTLILRVTDANTRPDRPNRAFHTPSSAEANTWNTDSTIFYITGEGGEAIAYNFDRVTVKATRMGDTGGPSGGSILPFGGEPTFSFNNKYLLYGMDAATGTILQQYDFQSGGLTNLLDVKTIVSSFTGGYVGGVSNSAGDKFNIYFGGQAQNDATFVVVWDKATHQSTLLNTQAGTVNGSVAGSISWGWTVHNSRIDKSGRYVVISTASGPYSLVVWDLQAGSFAPITDKGGGHKVGGFGYIINNDGFTDGDQWLIRPLSNVGSFSTLINPELSPTEWVADSHLSWNNAQSGNLVPVFLSTYHSQPSTAPWRAWDDEIVAVRTDGSQTTVWRFAHHFSTYVGFWSSPRGNISQDGRFFMFTSNWGNTLGTDREDAFIIKLPLQ